MNQLADTAAMSLRLQVLKIVMIIVVVTLSLLGVGLKYFILQYLAEIERKEQGDKLAIVSRMIEASEENLEAWATDLAVWDDTYQFVNGQNKNYLESNFPESTFVSVQEWNQSQSVHPTVIAIIDQSGLPKSTVEYDEATKKLTYAHKVTNTELIDTSKSIFEKMNQTSLGFGKKLIGYVRYHGDTFQFMSHQITASDEVTQSQYYFLVLRKWSKEEIAGLAKISGLEASYSSDVGPSTVDKNIWVESDFIFGDLFFESPFGQELFKITLKSARTTYKLGSMVSNIFIALILFFTFIVLASVTIVIDRLVVSRVSHLNKAVQAAKRESSAISKIIQAGVDEISQLSKDLFTLFAHLKDVSEKDPLTQLGNRRAFYLAVAEAQASPRSNRVCGVIIFDIDKFKVINDEYGHSQGDEIIKSFANILSLKQDEETYVARFGGEEFAIFCLRESEAEIMNLAEQIRSTFASTQQRVPDTGQIIVATASAGVAMSSASDYWSIDLLMNYADRALYVSKRNGRNRVSLHSLKAVA